MLAAIADAMLALDPQTISDWMSHAAYPILVGILVLASLGLPIPEDVPLIAGGLLLRNYPNAATWTGVLGFAMLGIMSGDIILYSLGRRWGFDVVSHRSVRWLITPTRFAKTRDKFRRYGSWMVFFGRFFMGVRAAMCLTAGATHFPIWRFILADMAGAALSIPLFVWLGYWFAGMLSTLDHTVDTIEAILLGLLVTAVVVALVVYKVRKAIRAARDETDTAPPTSTAAESLRHPAPQTTSGAIAPAGIDGKG